MFPPRAWLIAFAITVAVEMPIVLFLTRGSAMSPARRSAVTVFAQLMTHPLVWYVFPQIVGITGRTAMALSETWAWLGEAAFYAVVIPGLTPARAIGISAFANAASFAVGLALAR